jgi:arginine decarboxylase
MQNFVLRELHPGTSIEGINLSQKGFIVGNRIPKDYFVTTGIGQSDIAVHAGSYHLALKDAGIEMANIMTYSSILPGMATEIPRPSNLTHGEVMETIMAVANGNKGDRLSAGIVYGWLAERKTGQRYGGLVCEHNGNYTEKELERLLHSSINELYTNGFEERFSLGNLNVIKRSFVPLKTYGTVLVALCFTSYFYPILETL